MNKEAKKFLTDKAGYSKEQIISIIAASIHLHIFNITRTAKGISFTLIDNFFRLENVELENEDLKLWDVILGFDSIANGLNAIQYLLEEKKPMSWGIFDKQKSITPKSGEVRLMSVVDYLNSLDAKQKAYLRGMAGEWAKIAMKQGTSFDAFFVNGTDGLTLKNGDVVQCYDNQVNETYFGIVLGTMPNGFVSIYSGDIFSLSSHSSPVLGTEVPKEIKDELIKNYKKLADDFAEDKQIAFEKFEKAFLREEKARATATRKAEREAKAATKKALEELTTMEIKTPADIQKVTKEVNSLFDADDTNAHKRRVDAVKAKVTEAKAKIEAAKETAKSKATKKTAPAKAEKQTAEPAKA